MLCTLFSKRAPASIAIIVTIVLLQKVAGQPLACLHLASVLPSCKLHNTLLPPLQRLPACP
jgi:hypothetical protein